MAFAPAVVVAWCFVVGACIGSFLNVVAWRLPLGMSLLFPSSLCPACRKPILFRDNVPVFGWLRLRGRCRGCGTQISVRYPLVEFLTGAAFAVLAYFELVEEGVNLPIAAPGAAGDLIGIWVYHATLMALLIVVALFERDTHRPTRGLVIAGMIFALLPPLVFPTLHVVPLSGAAGLIEGANTANFGAAEHLLVGLAGLLVGGLLGALLEFGTSGGRSLRVLAHNGTFSLALCGGFLGWQAAVSIAVMASVILLIVQVSALRFPKFATRPALFVAIATVVQIVAWGKFAAVSWWIGPYASVQRAAIAGLAVAAAALILAAFSRLRPASKDPRMVN